MLSNVTFSLIQDVRNKMTTLTSEDHVKQLNSQLADARDTVTFDLQRNVYKNYTDFVIIGKEISKLESDMLHFRGLLRELSECSEGFSALLPTKVEEVGVFNKKTSLQDIHTQAVVTDKQANELKILYQIMDGLAKVLPEAPGRFIVRDGTTSRFSEINPATYKEKDQAFIYVLNDALVVATWRKNMITLKNRLVADRAFALEEIGFIDMKDSPELTNAFKIIKHPEDILFRSETSEEKHALLKIIQSLTEEMLLRKKKEKERQQLAVQATLAATPPTIQDKIKKKMPKDDLSVSDFRWLIELPDELDVLIAHRNFDDAVKCVFKARRILGACHGETSRVIIIRASINERIVKLSKLVALDLSSPVATKDQVRGDIDKLLRLGLGDQARDIFLSARSLTIRSRLRFSFSNLEKSSSTAISSDTYHNSPS